MCTGSASGHVALWNLEKRKLQSEIHAAHSAAVTGMKCLPSQPILVTSSPDNALKVRRTHTMLIQSMVIEFSPTLIIIQYSAVNCTIMTFCLLLSITPMLFSFPDILLIMKGDSSYEIFYILKSY